MLKTKRGLWEPISAGVTEEERAIRELLSRVDIGINGHQPWDIQIHDRRTLQRVLKDWSLGLGEAYMDGWWDCELLDEFFYRVLLGGLNEHVWTWPLVKGAIKANVVNLQRKSRAYIIAQRHYDIGNDLYSAMLDQRLVYSCGYWKNAKTLDEAQENKLELICRKIDLQPGMRVLDIGCGWGSFVKYAAEKCGVETVGVTVSKEQAALAREVCQNLSVEIRLQDYRDLRDKFDRIVSVGMIEHVGYKNYRDYMQIVHDCLAEDGIFLLQTIGTSLSTTSTDPWIDKYIFPNSMLPSVKQLAEAAEGLLVTEDLHNFGPDYDTTLLAWWRNFESHWPELRSKYGDRFYRMWRYYLLSCAGAFRARYNQLWQIVYSKKGVPGGYAPVR